MKVVILASNLMDRLSQHFFKSRKDQLYQNIQILIIRISFYGKITAVQARNFVQTYMGNHLALKLMNALILEI